MLILMILLLLTSCRENREVGENVYDAVIVGGGMAGLSAAYHLKSEIGKKAKILILEKEDRLGGRIMTKKYNKDIYELGAFFDYGSSYAPKGFEASELIKQGENHGCFINGNLYSSKTVAGLLRKIHPMDGRFFNEFDEDRDLDKLFASVSDDVKKAMVSSFKVIHFGEIKDYVNERKEDLFKTYNWDSREKGNYEFLENYKDFLVGYYLTGAEVKSVENRNGLIVVKYNKDSSAEEIQAKSVIVATPATSALKIIKNMKEKSEKFIKSVKYTKTAVVIFITKRPGPIDFSYILTPDKSFNSIGIYRSPDGQHNTFAMYFTDSFVNAHDNWKNDNYIDAAYKDLQSMQIIDLKSNLLHKDFYLWKEEGTIISEETYKNFSEEALNPLDGVFLAGDYTFWNHLKIPYGIPPAYFSGQSAAQKVLKYLHRTWD